MHQARLAVLLSLVAIEATGGEAPRVAVHPLVVRGGDAKLARAAGNAWLAEAAKQPIAMVSSFAVQDALTDASPDECVVNDACLQRLCARTHAEWALVAVVTVSPEGLLLSARAVNPAGALGARVDAVPGGGVDAQALEALMQSAFAGLSLATLSTPAAAVEPPKPEPVRADVPCPACPAAAPTVVLAPRTSPWRVAAFSTGGLAIAAAAAAGALLVVNGYEANALSHLMRDGLLPVANVPQAVAIDERNRAAVALFVGSGLSLALSITFALAANAAPELAR